MELVNGSLQTEVACRIDPTPPIMCNLMLTLDSAILGIISADGKLFLDTNQVPLEVRPNVFHHLQALNDQFPHDLMVTNLETNRIDFLAVGGKNRFHNLLDFVV